MTKEAVEFHVEGLRGLSNVAARFLQRRPKEARMAVIIALEAAAAQYNVGSKALADGVPDSLLPFVVRKSDDAGLIGVTEAADRLQVSRTTIYDWVEKQTLLGWKRTKRGLAIPAEQIVGPSDVVPGIAQVMAVIGDAELAWAFLSQEWPFSDAVARPIDRLKAGDVDEVIDAAPSFGATFT